MKKDQYIDLRSIYQRFGVAYATFKKALPFLNDFPIPVLSATGKQRGKPRFIKQQFEDWVIGKNLTAEMAAALKKAEHCNPAHSASAAKIIELQRRFTAGEFATEEQKQQFAMKRLIARTTKPKTTRISVVPDWMQDDDYQPNRAHRSQAHG